MASRNELLERAGALGFDGTTIANDSKLEQKIMYLLKNRTAFTGTAGTGVLTSDNTNNADGETVTVGDQVYTFKTALTPAAYEVLIGADADTSLLNLARCINMSGGTAGTDYAANTPVNRWVTCSATVTAHAITLTVRDKAVTNGSIATTETGAHISFGATTIASGVASVIAVGTSTSAGAPGLSGDKNVSV